MILLVIGILIAIAGHLIHHVLLIEMPGLGLIAVSGAVWYSNKRHKDKISRETAEGLHLEDHEYNRIGKPRWGDSSGSYSRGEGFPWGLAALIAFLAICGSIYGCSAISNTIKTDDALTRFQELAKTDNVEIVRQSNNSVLFGDPYSVSFELLIDGKPASGKCESGEFSGMVCRLYSGSGD